MNAMQVKDIKQDGLSHEMEVTLKAADIDKRIEESLQEYAKTVALPGFRKGKVPLKIMKQKYGRAVMGEVLEKAVNEGSTKALQERELEPAIQPKIEVKEFDEGKDLVFSMNVEVLPKFEIADFKGLKLEKLTAKPSDKEVDEALEKLAENSQSTQKVEEDRATKDGDTVVIDFDGRTADDDVHHAGMASEGHRLVLGSGSFIPGFEEQLVKQKAGDKVEVKVSFPEEYGASELAGRDAIFDVTIHEIHEAAEAKIDDEFAKRFGMDDVAALKAAVSEQLKIELDNNARMVLKKNILDQLDDIHTLDVPPTMLEMEFTNIEDQIKLDRQRSGDESELSEEEAAEFKEIAARRVRLGLILSAIGKANNIVVNDMELQKAVISEAQKYPGQEKAVFDYYAKNRNALESMRAPIFEEKVVDFILELADVTDKEISSEDLIKALDDDDSEEKPKKKASTAKKASSAKKDADAAEPPKKKAPAKKKAASKKKDA